MRIVSILLSLLFPIMIYAGPVVTNVSPARGPAAGGNLVQITGSGFTGATAVHFGTVPGGAIAVVSDTSIVLVAPESFAAGTIDVTVTTGSGTSPTGQADQYTYIGDWYAFVAIYSSQNLQFVNLSTDIAGTTLSLQSYANSLTVDPKAQTLYSTDGYPDLAPANLATEQALPIFNTGGLNADEIAITPDGKAAYLVITYPEYGIQVVDLSTGDLGSFISLSAVPTSLAITPDGKKGYVSLTSNQVYPIDLTLNILGFPFSAPYGYNMQITPDGTKAFMANDNGNYATYIDLTRNVAFNTIPIGTTTAFAYVNPNGLTVYFIDGDDEFVIPVDIATLSVGDYQPLGFELMAIAPDGKTAYGVSFENNHLVKVDLTTFDVLDNIPLSGPPLHIAISPDQAPIASFSFSAAPVFLESTFDASASITPVGTIVQYDWDFGDGNTMSTSLPIAAHIYETSGTFTVTLRVTNSARTSTTQTYTGQMVSNNGGPSAQTSQDVQIVPLYPPTNAAGVQIEIRFFTQTEFQNEIEWSPPLQGNPPVAYNIFKDASLTHLVAIVPASGKLKYVQHNVYHREYVYYIASIDADGNQSAAASVLVRPAYEQ